MAGPSDRATITSRWSGRLALGVLVAGLAAVGSWAHEDQVTCTVSHEEGLASASGYLVGDTSYRVRSSFSPELGGAGRLSLDVHARPVDPKTGLPRGLYVPGLVGSYRLLGSLGGSLASGELELEMTPSGPAYRTTLPIQDDREDLELQLSFSGPSTGDEGRDDSHDADSLCFRLRATDVALGGDPGIGAGNDGGFTSWNTRLVGQLAPRGDRYADLWGYSDGTTHLAIIGTFQGTSFIDVTVAESPVEVGFIEGPRSSWRDIKTYRHYAYIVTEGDGEGQGLQIVDLSNPLQPTLVNTYAEGFRTAHNLFIDEIEGQLFLAGTNDGMRILDVANDPENPIEVGTWLEHYVHDIYVRNGMAYMAQVFDGQMQIARFASPTQLNILATFPTPDDFTHNAWVDATGSLLVTTDETTGGHLAVYDLSGVGGIGGGESTATLLGEYDPNPTTIVHNAIFDDDHPRRVALSHYGLGLRYVDLHRPTMPVELGGYDTTPDANAGFIGAWGVYPRDPRGYFYVSDIETGLYVVEYVPTGGTLSGVVTSDSGEALASVKVQNVLTGVTVTSGADGVYATYAPAGDVLLRVSASGYRSRLLVGGELPLDGRLDVDVVLEPIERADLTGSVVRAGDGSAVRDATVRIDGLTLLVQSDDGGAFALPQLPVGRHELIVQAFGHDPVVRAVQVQPGAGQHVTVVLTPSALGDDVEEDRGWQFGWVGDEAVSGIWERVDPIGTGGGTVQPEHDHTADPGATAFITGQSSSDREAVEENDVDGGATTLVTPRFDLSGTGSAELSYYRWFSRNAGPTEAGTMIVSASNDDGATWRQLELLDANANSWRRRSFELSNTLTLTDRMRVRFRVDPMLDAELGVVEAGLDDIQVASTCLAELRPAALDGDGDGRIDICDVCPGDPIDDIDGDGACGAMDNAPFVANPDQADRDRDTVGDVIDNCPDTPNPFQDDLDGDGFGDACDDDLDSDGLDDNIDTDLDNDGTPNELDSCPTLPLHSPTDVDGDGVGDLCDHDDGLINGVRMDGALIFWDREFANHTYQVYRGFLGDRALVPLATCRAQGLTTTYAVDEGIPQQGDGFFYLVGRISGGQNGPLGFASDGQERVLYEYCD